jgi:hypothetical protein
MLFLFFLGLANSSASMPCLHYGGGPVTLTGKVEFKIFYGPPNYGENPETDSRETQAILLLSEPICVHANPGNTEESEQNQTEVTLVPYNNENLEDYMEKEIIVQGTLYHAHTGHHHTPVLMEIESIVKSGK